MRPYLSSVANLANTLEITITAEVRLYVVIYRNVSAVITAISKMRQLLRRAIELAVAKTVSEIPCILRSSIKNFTRAKAARVIF